MATRRGKALAEELQWGRDHDGRVRTRQSVKVVPVYKRVWFPHPYAVERKLLWVKLVVAYRYYDSNGDEFIPPWLDVPNHPNCRCVIKEIP